jgi:hypothetical protein
MKPVALRHSLFEDREVVQSGREAGGLEVLLLCGLRHSTRLLDHINGGNINVASNAERI